MNNLIEKSAALFFQNPVRSVYGTVSPYTSYGFYLAKNFFPRISHYQKHEAAYVNLQTRFRAVPIVMAVGYITLCQMSLAKEAQKTRARREQESQ